MALLKDELQGGAPWRGLNASLPQDQRVDSPWFKPTHLAEPEGAQAVCALPVFANSGRPDGTLDRLKRLAVACGSQHAPMCGTEQHARARCGDTEGWDNKKFILGSAGASLNHLPPAIPPDPTAHLFCFAEAALL
jgi:hypothetical protein